jgi:hypothetical protein
MAAQPRRANAYPPNSDSRTVPTIAIRHALRAIASESGRGEGLNRVRLLRPLVARAHDILCERLGSGGSAEAYLRDRARLADSMVIGLLHIASISCGIRDGSMVAPLAAIAAGGYGRRELAPGSDLDLLFLLPESSRAPRWRCRAGNEGLHQCSHRKPLGSRIRGRSCGAVGQ